MHPDENARRQQTHELELELVSVRSSAEAARLEARAAELELLLRRLSRDADLEPSLQTECDFQQRALSTNQIARSLWSDRLSRLKAREPSSHSPGSPALVADRGEPPREQSTAAAAAAVATATAAAAWVPRIRRKPGDDGRAADDSQSCEPIDVSPHRVTGPPASVVPAAKSRESSSKSRGSTAATARKPRATSRPLPAVVAAGDQAEKEPKRRFRPASWLVSTLAHVAILVLLGLMTLASSAPKDQLALTASVTESQEESIETFTIESSEPQDTEPATAETAYDVSPLGTMAVTEVSMDIPTAPAVMTTTDLLRSSDSSVSRSMLKTLTSDSPSKMQFCGVDGGGNHFVYLVDSSGSMRDGFQSARSELLSSIDQLKQDQRFYVVFFDDDPEYMRIRDPNADEPTSVMATEDNKQRLRKWAMTVQMNKGKAPYEVLPFALTLRPDVIFLLSDGEFPSRIEDILREQNHEENLFGENGPISIVHTIRYHGIEGETGRKAEQTMRKIAKENGGQYRHVPKPR